MSGLSGKREKFEELGEYITLMKEKPGPLMPIMQKAQEIFDSLSFDVQEFIANEMGIPMSDVYGVATFYSQFALEAKGDHVIGVCMGTACYVKGAESVLNALSDELDTSAGMTTKDRKFTLEATRCLGCCGLAPVIMIDDQVFGRLKADDIPGIIAQYRNR